MGVIEIIAVSVLGLFFLGAIFRRRQGSCAGGSWFLKSVGTMAILGGIALFWSRGSEPPRDVHVELHRVTAEDLDIPDVIRLQGRPLREHVGEWRHSRPSLRWMFVLMGTVLIIGGSLLFSRDRTRPVAFKAFTLLGIAAILYIVVAFFNTASQRVVPARETLARLEPVRPATQPFRPELMVRPSRAKHARRPKSRPERPVAERVAEELPPRAGEIPVAAEMAQGATPSEPVQATAAPATTPPAAAPAPAEPTSTAPAVAPPPATEPPPPATEPQPPAAPTAAAPPAEPAPAAPTESAPAAPPAEPALDAPASAPAAPAAPASETAPPPATPAPVPETPAASEATSSPPAAAAASAAAPPAAQTQVGASQIAEPKIAEPKIVVPLSAPRPLVKADAPAERPDWIDSQPQLVKGVYILPVRSGLFASLPECQGQLSMQIKREADHYIDELLRDLGEHASEVVKVSPEYLERFVKKAEYSELRVSDSVGPMHQIHALLEFDDEARANFRRRWHDAVVTDRLWFTGAGAALVLALLGTFYGYLRLDSQTGGAHKGKLRLAATLAALIAAASALMLRHSVLF